MTAHSPSLAEEIAAELRDDVLRGQYRAGERLPSERDLAARFNASRGAVREALKKLEQLGLADIRPGGVRVVPIADATLEVLGHLLTLSDQPDATLVSQVLDVVGALMAMSARTAIEVASEAQLGEMRTIVGELLAGGDDRPQHDWRELGVYFTEVNQNLVLRLVGNGLKTHFVGRLQNLSEMLNPDSEEAQRQLHALDQAIAERSARDVESCILEHFAFIKRTILEALVAAPAPATSFQGGPSAQNRVPL